jgi:hypothetical protein
MDRSEPWVGARVAWFLVVVGALPVSALFWIAGAYAFCGTDTTEPGKLGDWACGNLVHPVAPWAAIAAAPVAALLVGGWIALRRRDWRLFGFFLIVPPLLLVGGFLTITALF